MAAHRLSRLQRRILAWLLAEEQRTRGTMAADHRDLVRALAHDKGNLSTSLKGLEQKGLIRIHRTPGGKAEAIALTAEGGERAEVVNKTGRHHAMTITCATCGRDSGASAELDDAALAILDRENWRCAVPQIGQPFRFYCPACWPAARHDEAQP
jgi:DNA-binding MarR family transcriptional regulator